MIPGTPYIITRIDEWLAQQTRERFTPSVEAQATTISIQQANNISTAFLRHFINNTEFTALSSTSWQSNMQYYYANIYETTMDMRTWTPSNNPGRPLSTKEWRQHIIPAQQALEQALTFPRTLQENLGTRPLDDLDKTIIAQTWKHHYKHPRAWAKDHIAMRRAMFAAEQALDDYGEDSYQRAQLLDVVLSPVEYIAEALFSDVTIKSPHEPSDTF